MRRWIIPFAALVLFISFGSTAGLSNTPTYVLTVGSDRSFEPALAEPKYASLDSQRFARAMELVAQVPVDHIKVLNNATIGEFRATLDKLVRSLESSKQIKRFVFFFSGHSDERGIHFRDALFSKDELHEFLRRTPSQTKISILDSCYSGALAAKGIEPSVDEFVIPRTDFDEPIGTVFLTASSADEGAFESPRFEGSVFSNYLVSGLYGSADSNGDGLVTIEELYQFIYQKTRYDNLMLPHGIQQQPEFVSRLKGRGALVLSEPKTTLQPLKLDPKISGEVRLYATYGLKAFTFSKEVNSAKTVQLPPGEYNFSVQSGNKVGQTTVKLDATKVASVEFANLRWQTVKANESKLKGFDSQMMSYGALVGVHSGHLVQEAFGPEAGMWVGLGRPSIGPVTFRPFAAFFARQNRLNTEFGEAAVSSTSLLGGAKFQWEENFIPRFDFYGLVAGGAGIQTQRWHRETGDESYSARHPIAHFGIGSEYAFQSGLKLGLEYRREVIRINDQELGTQVLAGNIIGATIGY